MFENWGFLLSEVLGLIILAALVGLGAGWLTWGRRVREVVREVTVTDKAEVERLQAALESAGQEINRLAAFEAEAAQLRAALTEAQKTITEYVKASALAAVPAKAAPPQAGEAQELLDRIAQLESELEEAQSEGAELSNRYDELAEELAEHQRDALLMVERVSTLEHELAQYRDEAPEQELPKADPSIGTRPEALDAPRGGWGDDLTQIKGVGTVLEALLHRLGIYHFDQIAAWTDEELAWIDENLEGFKGRASRDNWIEQAKELTKA